MEDPKHGFLDGLEKYQHFSTGLMFAIAAAAIQSSKLEGVDNRQAAAEITAWSLIIFAAVFGLYISKFITTLRMTQDTVFMTKDRMNRIIDTHEFTMHSTINKEGKVITKNKQDTINDLRIEFETAINNYNINRERVDHWTTIQMVAFTIGIVFLGGARAAAHWTHGSNSTVVVAISK